MLKFFYSTWREFGSTPNFTPEKYNTAAELGGRVLRVVTLADGKTIHNAFPDRNFKLPVP
jgi:hypothetical protein